METPQPLGFWLSLVERLVEERFAALLDEHGVTRRQWELLNVLADQSVPTGTGRLADDPETAELVDSGWVRRESEDFVLTEKGHVAREGLRDAVARLQELTTSGLTPEEYDATVATLGRMARNLGWEG